MPVVIRNSPFETNWRPGRVSKDYADNYDAIDWSAGKKTDLAKKGKAKESLASMYLEAEETKKICTTPLAKRDDKWCAKYLEGD